MAPKVHWPLDHSSPISPSALAREIVHDVVCSGRPAWVIDVERARERFRSAAEAASHQGATLLVAVKSCGEPALLAAAAEAGVGFDVSNLREIDRVELHAGAGVPVSLTSPALPPYEREEVYRRLTYGMPECANWDSLMQLEDACRALPNTAMGVRVFAPDCASPAVVEGVLPHSRFGVRLADLPLAIEVTAAHGCVVDALHVHNGSGRNTDAWFVAAARSLVDAAADAGITLRRLNLGGGLPCADTRDLTALLAGISGIVGRAVEPILEPGEWWTQGCVWLVTQILEVKTTELCHFVVIDAGSENHRRWSVPSKPCLGSPGQGYGKPIVICGRTCSERDYFIQVDPVKQAPPPEAGNWVVLGMSGYSLELENSFGGLAPLPRVLVDPKATRIASVVD